MCRGGVGCHVVRSGVVWCGEVYVGLECGRIIAHTGFLIQCACTPSHNSALLERFFFK